MTVTKEFKDLSNYEKLVKVAQTFAGSQGFYSRLLNNLEEMGSDEIEQVNNLEEFKSCKDTLDVVMALEG